MPQSLSRILIYLVFSIKDRAPFLTPEIRAETHPYLTAILRDNECPPLNVGGPEDHVHLLFGLSRTRPVAEVVEAVKSSSSKWLKTKGLASFRWQSGYGAFSVSQSGAGAVVRYIDGQVEHHKKQPFHDEFRHMLERYQIEYDERYVWD